MLYTLRLKDTNGNNIEFVGSKEALNKEYNMLKRMNQKEIKNFLNLDTNDTDIEYIILLDEMGEVVKYVIQLLEFHVKE